MNDDSSLWQRYRRYLSSHQELGMSLDISRMRFGDDFLEQKAPDIAKALAKMQQLEEGAIANADENRMVGHYWLRAADRAPSADIRDSIAAVRTQIVSFVGQIHRGELAGEGGRFENLLLVGIGGSALGPQFLAHALGTTDDRMTPYFFDNTDPDGIDRVLARLGSALGQTLVIVISKSGGTHETRNGMLEAQRAYREAGLDFGRHAVAITKSGSALDERAQSEKWLKRFPMWDWVGGRTSVTSAVGCLPAALQGIDIDAFLAGAAEMDEVTRQSEVDKNPAALLALMWYYAGDGRGTKEMIVLPYKDRLELFSKYLQQLVMESLGKDCSRQGKIVHQGITVFGNKGSTDQHSYVQQLRDGLAGFFVTFIEVLHDRAQTPIEVERGVTTGDYLNAFLQGTRQALYENGRESITITINGITPRQVGQLIALFERAVGLYAELIDINAYHQPGVEAGKKAARKVLDLQLRVLEHLLGSDEPLTVAQIANALGQPERVEPIYKLLRHLAANRERRIAMTWAPDPADATFMILAQ